MSEDERQVQYAKIALGLLGLLLLFGGIALLSEKLDIIIKLLK